VRVALVTLVTLVTVQWSHVTFGFRGDGAHKGWRHQQNRKLRFPVCQIVALYHRLKLVLSGSWSVVGGTQVRRRVSEEYPNVWASEEKICVTFSGVYISCFLLSKVRTSPYSKRYWDHWDAESSAIFPCTPQQAVVRFPWSAVAWTCQVHERPVCIMDRKNVKRIHVYSEWTNGIT
jgi:hypothetical protein